jgi:hypothetical protein
MTVGGVYPVDAAQQQHDRMTVENLRQLLQRGVENGDSSIKQQLSSSTGELAHNLYVA